MRKTFALLAALLVASPAMAGDVLKYSTTVAGLPLGKLRVVVDTQDPQYRVRIGFSMIPILRQILNGDAKAEVAGVVARGRYIPRESVFRYEGRRGERRTAIVFDDGGVPVDLMAEPPLRQTDDRMTLGEAAGAIDPATAAAILMAPRAQPCNVGFDVFDGAKRHRISLNGEAAPAQDGIVTCAGLYERVNGFKAKYMTPERRSWPFRAMLTNQRGRWIPVKITADTKFGPASATLKR